MVRETYSEIQYRSSLRPLSSQHPEHFVYICCRSPTAVILTDIRSGSAVNAFLALRERSNYIYTVIFLLGWHKDDDVVRQVSLVERCDHLSGLSRARVTANHGRV